jgi:hypothetical protein
MWHRSSQPSATNVDSVTAGTIVPMKGLGEGHEDDDDQLTLLADAHRETGRGV